MASRKVLKRDIDFLTSELLSDCVLYIDLYPNQETEPVSEIINSVLLKKQEIFAKINQPTPQVKAKVLNENRAKKLENRKEVKNNYKQVIAEMLAAVNEGYEKLSKLPRK
ncbi:MAG: hypothetical protein HUK15_08380 [Bacteroidales bacterium]|nr:hypothetical protein [Bacteroidales bacterium]